MTRDRASALVLRGPREFERHEISLPEIGDDDGILRIEACGLCGTDHEEYTGHITAPYRFIPGHEVVGVVEQAGDAALERWGVAVGDRVAVEVFMSCRQCAACLAGANRRCEHHGLADMYGFIDVDKAPGLWGGYATHLYLGPDALLLPVPNTLDPFWPRSSTRSVPGCGGPSRCPTPNPAMSSSSSDQEYAGSLHAPRPRQPAQASS
jgi:alcohol dehydrogenase